jgi:hypothetical protein
MPLKPVRRSLENTNTTVNLSTATILKSLDAKRGDAATKERAEKWFPIAQNAQKNFWRIYSSTLKI